jgi:tetratricopeptide (TPR) repeat protein
MFQMDRFNLGSYRRPISTSAADTQRWFDAGLNWCYGFNHDEGIRCFQRALEADRICPMVHWGLAYASGPFYNLTWRELGAVEARMTTKRCFEHVQAAKAHADRASEVERELIDALSLRFPKPHPVALEEYAQWDDAYAAEMRRVYHRHPDDRDVTALFVEALMMRTVRKLWDLKTGAPAPNSDALEAQSICEEAIARADAAGVPHHPAILHLHIHLMEMSAMPERAMRSADLLGVMCPDAGHMNHMPGHIYVLCGEYKKAKHASEKAIRANNLYLDYADTPTYYLLGCGHDLHLMMYTCMFLGQARPAILAADEVRRLMTDAIISLPDRPKFTHTVEGYRAMRSHVQVRFGLWHDIIDEPMAGDPRLHVMTTALQHYAKGVAHAKLRNFAEADIERDRLDRHLETIPPERRFLSNPARASLEVGVALLDGEMAYHQGQHEAAYRHLRRAVELDDNLSYTEPWAWMHPPRHALAALLLDQGHIEEAEQVCRDDLGLTGNVQRCARHPDNVWALHGLVECLRRRDEREERPHWELKLKSALARADVPITSSCMCRGDTTGASCCH